MSELKTYTYTVLRYVHDITAGEFVNVGVALFCPSERFVAAKMRPTYGRITRVFPGSNGEYFKQMMSYVNRQFEKFSNEEMGLISMNARTVMEFAHRAFPADDSSLQWSPAGSGKTANPAKTLEQMFQRLVMRYDDKHDRSRNDQDVWQVFSKELAKRQVLDRLEEKKIVGSVDEVSFKHSWKNGKWHCLEPLSFDLVEPESIRDKARKFFGQIQLVNDANENFKLYLLLGEPKHKEVAEAYNSARRILERPADCEIFTEEQADMVSSRVAAEMVQHDADPSALTHK